MDAATLGDLLQLAYAAQLPDWRFWMAGFGPIDPDKWLLPNVHVLKNRKGQSLAELYQAADLLLIPSYGEGFPLVIQEAMACGLPVITTENCGAPVPDESWRVPAMDPAALAARISRYADDRGLIESEGRLAREFAAKFTPGAYRATMSRFFLDLLKQRGALN